MGLLQNFNKNKNHIPAHDPAFIINPPTPAHPDTQEGVCLIVGTHPNVDREVDAALLKFPHAKICAVNEATALLPADFLATCHPERLALFLSLHDQNWDTAIYPIPEIHAMQTSLMRADVFPLYAWSMGIGGGSAMFAAAAMIGIGFDQVILCGCPVSGGGGYALSTHEGTPSDPRVGEVASDHSMVQAWHNSMRALVDKAPQIAVKIRSMSGYTREVFGGIE